MSQRNNEVKNNKNNVSIFHPNNIEKLLENNPQVNDLKRKSKVLHKKLKEEYKSKQKTDFIPLRQCQDIVAQQHGYKHWHEFHTIIKKAYLEKEEKDFLKYSNEKQLIPQFISKKSPVNIGYDYNTGLQAWYDQDKLLEHVFINGSNAFRDKMELHLIKQMINEGQHIIYMDGENNIEHQNKIIKEAINAGRENDIRILSFMTPRKRSFELKNMYWKIPENLPFSSGGLAELLIALFDEYDIDSDQKMWQGRAISLISALMMALVYMREKKEITLSLKIIRKYLQFDEFFFLSQRKDFPEHIIKGLNSYLFSLPQYNSQTLKQVDTCREHHGYLQMQFIRIFGLFVDSYGYLFEAGLSTDEAKEKFNELYGENKNLIFIIEFPDFEKSTDELKRLPIFILSLMKNQMANQLGRTIENKHQQLLKKQNNAIIIRQCFLHDIGVMPTQSRNLNTSLVLSYDIKDENKINITNNVDVYKSLMINMATKIVEDKNNSNKIQYTLRVEDRVENLQLE